jgi:hypothetical protein
MWFGLVESREEACMKLVFGFGGDRKITNTAGIFVIGLPIIELGGASEHLCARYDT